MNDSIDPVPTPESEAPAPGASAQTHERIDNVADRIKEGASAATDATARSAHRAADKAGASQAYAEDLFYQACNFVRTRPLESVAIAVAAGWVMGRLMAPRD